MPRSIPITILVVACALTRAMAAEPAVDFSREILPLLSDRCFHCHGPDPDHREAELRLDDEQEAKRDRDGQAAVVPGDAAASLLWQRIASEDPDERMPPADANRKPLSDADQQRIRRWIEEGAKWGKHWAFEKPRRPAVPDGAPHPVDAFVLRRLQAAGLSHSPAATPAKQLRRLSFDLIGLPPQPEDVAAIEEDSSETAWRAAVDRLLQSPHHGERLAMWWLDAARYSDTDGYQGDAERTNWPWRDWVIQAFNANMPFDQFTREQFAGDLLENATPEQILATCFHRNHMTNGEGGRDPEESRIDYVIDRVNTTGTVWLGLTLGCTQCHSHKFDPISHHDYYRLTAFFNSIDEDGRAGRSAKPYLKYSSPLVAPRVAEMQQFVESWEAREAISRKAAEQRFEDWLKLQLVELPADYRAWRSLAPRSVQSAEGTEFQVEEDGVVQATGPSPRQDDYRVTVPVPRELTRLTGWKLEVFPHASHTDGKLSRGKQGEFILTNVKLFVRRKGASQVRDIEMAGAVADFERKAKGRNYGNVRDTLDDDPRNGWTTESAEATESHTALFELAEPLELATDEELVFLLQQRSTIGDANIGRFRLWATDQVGETVRVLKTPPLDELAAARSETLDELDGALRARLRAQFLLDDRAYQRDLTRLNEARRQLAELKKAAGASQVMVLKARAEPRETHLLVRGVWNDKGDRVEPGVLPAVLPWPADESRSRLDLANWLVSPDNPLTARVVVNHLWQLMFGAGLVRTPEDFGRQGEMPTHPDLLDWLAVELIEHDWDIRHVLRLIATSQTYRQSSEAPQELRARDPENRLLARAPRFRLPAWMIRDNALRASGLLNPQQGGPPVMPWQPEGVWREIFMGRFTYRPSVGPAQYRRTVYAYWRRSSAPTFLFDSAQRRVCEVRPRRTNTPLHALALLNDTAMLEASRVLADQARDVAEQDKAGATAALQELAVRILSRRLEDRELEIFQATRQRALQFYQTHRSDAVQFCEVGQQEAPPAEQAATVASWMTVASMMLNLDEAMTHE